MKTQRFAYNIAGMMEETAEDIKMLDMTNFMEEESLILRESQQDMFEPSSFSFMEVEVDTSMSTKKKAFVKKPSVSPYDDNKQNRNSHENSKAKTKKQKRFPLRDITSKIIQISPTPAIVPPESFPSGPKPSSIRKRLQF